MRFVFFFQIYENAFQLLHFLSGKTFLFENGYGPVVAHCCETENDFIVVDDGDDDDVVFVSSLRSILQESVGSVNRLVAIPERYKPEAVVRMEINLVVRCYTAFSIFSCSNSSDRQPSLPGLRYLSFGRPLD